LIALLIVLVLIAAVFAYNNPESIAVDIGLMRLDNVPKSIAFATAFALGWLFGLVTAALALLRMLNERRRMKRGLRFAEAEVRGLRSLPLNDAD
jgi:uncharacterized integral membrane protein